MSILINSIEISLELYEKLLNDGYNFDNMEKNEEVILYNELKKSNRKEIKNNTNIENDIKRIDLKNNNINIVIENKIDEKISDINIEEKIKNINNNNDKNLENYNTEIKSEIIKKINEEIENNILIEKSIEEVSNIIEELKEESKAYENNNEIIDSDIDKEIEEKIKEEIKEETNEILEKQKKEKKKKLKVDSVVPLNIFQTWHTKDMPYNMKLNVARIRFFNPEFKYYFFDDNDCREFIKKHFPISILWAFDKLRPGAFKADLWRYCVLYIHGGIYMDIKLRGINKFKLLHLTTREHFVLDYPNRVNSGIYNALMSVKPRNKILGKCILQILFNVKNRYYGPDCLCPTGPNLLSKFLTLEDKMRIRLFLHSNDPNRPIIRYGLLPIIEMYPEYRGEQGSNEKLKHYSILWSERAIYN